MMFDIFDSDYILLVFIPRLVLSELASWRVKSAFEKYSQIGTRRNYNRSPLPVSCYSALSCCFSLSHSRWNLMPPPAPNAWLSRPV
jgi:hypothetical protein